MTNAELIAALQNCANVNYEYLDEGASCSKCQYKEANYCKRTMLRDAADALEAANERIVNLLTALHLANEKLAYVDCQPYTEIDGEEMIDDWVKTLVYEELHAQLPKEGEWITTRTENHDGEIYCSVCDHDAPTEGDYRQVKTDYCPSSTSLYFSYNHLFDDDAKEQAIAAWNRRENNGTTTD